MFIQRKKIFENRRIQNVKGEIKANKSTWLQWYARANAFHNKVSQKSYAQVLKHGKQIMIEKNDHKVVQQVVTKVPNTGPLHDSTIISKQKQMCTDSTFPPSEAQANVVVLKNRFHILHCEEPKVSDRPSSIDSPLAVAKPLCLVGNKNGNGQKLGQATCIDSHSAVAKPLCLVGNKNGNGQKLGQATKQCYTQVDSLVTPSRGNKNKTGKKLGLHSTQCFRTAKNIQQNTYNRELSQRQPMATNVDIRVQQTAHSPQEHADILFKGNKNGNGPKLGSMNIEDGVQDTVSNSLQFDKTMETCNITTHMSNVTKQRKKNIPDTVKFEKIYSKDHNRCMYQNKARFGFLPYNDLLVYTGQEVIWANIPNIIEAHNLIRKSGLPNFLGQRIPVQSQLKISS